jgi:hypothetical protein
MWVRRPLIGTKTVRRAKTVTKERPTGIRWRDIFSGVAAFSAFIISVVTFYVTTFKTLDEVQVVIPSPPNLILQGKSLDTASFAIADEQELLFFNAGTQPAAIIGINLILVASKEGATCEGINEYSLDAESYPYDFEHLIIEPHKIVPRKIKIHPTNAAVSPRPVYKSGFKREKYGDFGWQILKCLQFTTVIPGKQLTATIDGGQTMFSEAGDQIEGRKVNSLQTLVRRVSTILDQ